MDAIDHGGEHVANAGAELRLDLGRVNLVIKAIESLPLLSRNLFADLPSVFARDIDARGHRSMMKGIEDEFARHRLDVAVPLKSAGVAKRSNQLRPAHLLGGAAGVEHQIEGHIELTDSILRPLEVTAHPIEAVRNA